MPFIQVNTTLKLSQEKKDTIARRIGAVIDLIPNKSEPVLMIDIHDGDTMYFGGERKENCCFVDVRCYKNAPFEANKAFTEAVFKLLMEETPLQVGDIYLAVNEYPTWGTKGSMK